MKYSYLVLKIITFILIVSSCKKEFVSEETIKIRMNHYYTVGQGMMGQELYRLVQTEENFGTDQWTPFFNNIENFNYEIGYIYELSLIKKTIAEPGNDQSPYKYILKREISKSKVTEETPFEIPIKTSELELQPFFYVNRVSSEKFQLLYQIDINCGIICDSLLDKLNDSTITELNGVFIHTDLPNTIELVDLIEK